MPSIGTTVSRLGLHSIAAVKQPSIQSNRVLTEIADLQSKSNHIDLAVLCVKTCYPINHLIDWITAEFSGNDSVLSSMRLYPKDTADILNSITAVQKTPVDFTVDITIDSLAEIKRLLNQSVPEIKSSHRVEAMARGLGFTTYAGLITRLEYEKQISVKPTLIPFEGFLSQRYYNTNLLQSSLLLDAVLIACNVEWNVRIESLFHGLEVNNVGPIHTRSCLHCIDRLPESLQDQIKAFKPLIN